MKKEDPLKGDYMKKIAIFENKLAAAGEKLKDSQLILITLNGLGMEYQPFVTSIIIQFDHTMTFSQ